MLYEVITPEIYPAGIPQTKKLNLNVHKPPEALSHVSVKIESTGTLSPGTRPSLSVLINYIGDTIPTGVPLSMTGSQNSKMVQLVLNNRMPLSTKALIFLPL